MRTRRLLAFLAVVRSICASSLDGERSSFVLDVLAPGSATSRGLCKPSGMIQDARCHFEDVETLNEEIQDKLGSLVQTPFFRYYKARSNVQRFLRTQTQLFRECPFWQEQGSCMNRACAVETSDESLLPERWRGRGLGDTKAAPSHEVPSGLEDGCIMRESDFCVREDESSLEGEYVDLVENPERFTGYAGHSAHNVWKAIYEENCFGAVPYLPPSRGKDSGGSGFISDLSSMGKTELKMALGSLAGPRDVQDTEMCLEKRVFYRIISGLHASISIHICKDYLNQETGEWEPNLECFITRIAQHPERLQNVYFDYVLMLRAFAKIGPYLREFDTCTGDDRIDAKTRKAVADLVDVAQSTPTTFDERSMFVGSDATQLKAEFKDHFRNVSRIMDCVGCDKCRLWGKLQITGLGTALKLLFSFEDDANAQPLLERSEVVAFVNTFQRFAASLASIEHFRQMWAEREKPAEPIETSKTQQIVDWRPKVLDRALEALRNAPKAPKPVSERQIIASNPRRSLRTSMAPQNKRPSVFAPRRDEQLDTVDALLIKVLAACRESWLYCVQAVARMIGRASSDEL